ncbi:MAG: hypothetical protein IJS94_04395, partial [Clostridia bacterium]|nr:hypothetical protein [Clostridia bacterium]
IYTLGYYNVQYEDGTWSAEKGIKSYVTKCGSDGEVDFQLEIDGSDYISLTYLAETEKHYCICGMTESEENDEYHSEVQILFIDKSGKLDKTVSISENKYNSPRSMEYDGKNIVVTFDTHNGYAFVTKKKCVLSEDGEILSSEIVSGTYTETKTYLGSIDGKDVFSVDDIPSLPDGKDIQGSLEGGYITSVIDYGDKYLVVSERITGRQPMPLYLSSIWFYSETVYMMVSKSEGILWRASVDSSIYHGYTPEDITGKTEPVVPPCDCEYDLPLLDSAEFDIDNDGEDEYCSVTYGPTSGLFTITLSACDKEGNVKYKNTFSTVPGDIKFAMENGEFMLYHCLDDNRCHYHAISVDKDIIVLSNVGTNGCRMEYWGT